jgi:hypothetical protein
MTDWITWDFSTITSFVFWGLAIVAYFARHALKEWVSKRATHGLERSIAELQSKLRQQETELSSQLEQERGRLGAVQATVLELMATRKRRAEERTIDAAEKLWKHIIALGPGHVVAKIVTIYKVNEIMESVPTNDRIANVIKSVGPNVTSANFADTLKEVDNARLYLPAHIWKLFTAYSSIITVSVAFRESASQQLDMRRYFNFDGVKADVKAAMPELSQYVDEHEWNVTGNLVDGIKDRLLAELRAVVLGEAVAGGPISDIGRLNSLAEFKRLSQQLEQSHPELVAHPDAPPKISETQTQA